MPSVYDALALIPGKGRERVSGTCVTAPDHTWTLQDLVSSLGPGGSDCMIIIFLFRGVCDSVGEDGGRPPHTHTTTTSDTKHEKQWPLWLPKGLCAARFRFCGKKNKMIVPGCFPHISVTKASHTTRLPHSFLHSFAHLILKHGTFQTQTLDLGAGFQQEC